MRSFSRAARTYDESSTVQTASAERLAVLLAGRVARINRLLDVGCGTGCAARRVGERVAVGMVVGVDVTEAMLRRVRLCGPGGVRMVADAETLPIASGAVDGAVANFVFQWIERPQAALNELARVLTPRAFLGLSVMGTGSLSELQRAIREALGPARSARYYEADEFVQMLEAARFSVLSTERTDFEVSYDSLDEMLKSLKAMGALVPAPAGGAGLGGRERLRRLNETIGPGRPIGTRYVVHYFLAQSSPGV